MEGTLRDEVARRLELGQSPAKIRADLLKKGYARTHIDAAVTDTGIVEQSAEDRRNSRLFTAREILDRVGYGAAAPQFINILFVQAGAGLFLLGFLTACKAVLSLFITSMLQGYAEVHRVSKNMIAASGILFGFSFLFMAFAVRAHVVWLYSIGILLAAVGVVAYGDLYHTFVAETLRHEKRSQLLLHFTRYGILLTVVSMLLSGWLIDRFPDGGSTVTLHAFGTFFSVEPIGYLLAFETTAFMFIIGGYLLSFVRERREERSHPLGRFISEHSRSLRTTLAELLKNRYVALLFIATAITGLLEVLGNTYYGLFIYEQFKDKFLGGFLNVAVILTIAVLVSFLGQWFTRKMGESIGLSPMLVFGTLLTAILPLTLVFNAHVVAVTLGFGLAVIGGVIVGFAQGLLARKLMDEGTRKRYFMSVGMLLVVPYLVLIPLGAWLAAAYGMTMLFLAVGIGLAAIAAPLYFLLVALANKERL